MSILVFIMSLFTQKEAVEQRVPYCKVDFDRRNNYLIDRYGIYHGHEQNFISTITSTFLRFWNQRNHTCHTQHHTFSLWRMISLLFISLLWNISGVRVALFLVFWLVCFITEVLTSLKDCTFVLIWNIIDMFMFCKFTVFYFLHFCLRVGRTV